MRARLAVVVAVAISIPMVGAVMDGTLNLSSAAERFLVGLVLSYVGVNLLAKLLESYFSTSNQTEAHDEQD